MLRPASLTLALASLALSLGLFADEPSSNVPVVVPHSTQFDLTSKEGATYRIFVGEPVNPPPAEGAPVVYVLDGNPNFAAMLAAVRRGEPASTGLVVAVGYPTEDSDAHSDRRYVDLTTEADPKWLETQPPTMRPEKTGGQAAFLRFLLDELRPEIERRYKIDPKRQALFGHSLGGLFVLHAYFAQPDAFRIYGASSPSIWWNGRDVLVREKEFAAKHGAAMPTSRLIVTTGEFERPAPGLPPERAKLLAERRMGEEARELVERLAALSGKPGTITYEELAKENHGSALLPACNRTAQELVRTGRPSGSPPTP